jgi:hypothetical protein
MDRRQRSVRTQSLSYGLLCGRSTTISRDGGRVSIRRAKVSCAGSLFQDESCTSSAGPHNGGKDAQDSCHTDGTIICRTADIRSQGHLEQASESK